MLCNLSTYMLCNLSGIDEEEKSKISYFKEFVNLIFILKLILRQH